MEYKVFYYIGDDFGMKTVIKTGIIKDMKKSIILEDKKDGKIIIDNVKSIKLKNFSGVGDVLELKYNDKKADKTVFMAAYKGICFANFFVRIDDKVTSLLENEIMNFKETNASKTEKPKAKEKTKNKVSKK